ncbi:(d)CMP kinase [Rhodobacteraceae bacterium 2CG4]|uniref:Cytidylate kinase n=1 Tax=Halovulum marinum TaxID=2662447 RepID=A0A6L5Z6W5_9RHOB|nr:(d)CMP kinase [Halovulum marinum]MSU92306.1 (d)CMP kinase [Halovulum marinum]
MKFTVAIDGPAAAGKGTIARAVAAEFGFAHLDTGLLYRAVGVKALERAGGVIDPIAAELIAGSLTEADLKRADLRTTLASRAASKVAAIPGVRAALLRFQHDFARRDGGAVLDGRDIGSVICPDAEVKLFVTADDARRAQRRHRELAAAGSELTVAQVLADLKARDARDSRRKDAPLTRAPDAVLLDTTELSIDCAVAEATALIRARIEQGRD